MTKIFAVYNNKGGVSKTTTLFNVAVFLSKKNNKVLIADFDPQCNASELCLASKTNSIEPTLELNENEFGTSMSKAFKNRLAGEEPRVNPLAIKLFKDKNYENLYLFRGDICFCDADDKFADAWIKGSKPDNTHEQYTYYSIYDVLQRLGNGENSENEKFDYIFCDLGPSTNFTNRLVLLSCDGYFIPLVPDRFNVQALRVIFGRIKEITYCKTSIPNWRTAHDEKLNSFPPALKDFPGKPEFLGGIMINLAGTYFNDELIETWKAKLKRDLKFYLTNERMSYFKEAISPQSPFITEIGYLGPLPNIAHIIGRAIFDLEEQHIREKRVENLINKICGITTESTIDSERIINYWPQWSKVINEYKTSIEEIATICEKYEKNN